MSCALKIYRHLVNWYKFISSIAKILYCWFQVVTIGRERLVSEKQSNKASAEGAKLPKGAMLLRDIFKFTELSLDAFRPTACKTTL